MEERIYTVPGMSCAHCERAVSEELSAVAGVESVGVDLETKRVVVRGDALEDAALRAAIDEAGYEADEWPTPSPSANALRLRRFKGVRA